MKAYMFPGQGSQHVGMGEVLFDAFSDLVACADAILGYSIRELCLKDTRRELTQTQFTQPALYVVNALAWRQRRNETDENPDFVAGHSLGEYNALECSGVFGFEEGLRLVKRRGELMTAAPKGSMAAIIGASADKVRGILDEHGLAAIDIANINAPTQIILSGLEADIRAAQICFERNQAMYIPLNVSGAFHSRCMQPIAADFGNFLKSSTFAPPRIPVIANVNGLPYQPGEVAQCLTEQLSHPVRWLDGMNFLLQSGVTDFIELGPGDVLTKLARSIKAQFRPTPPTAPKMQPSARDPRQTVTDWNRFYPVGTAVTVKGYDQPLTTRTPACILFGHRAAVYMQGYNGYFAVDEVTPLTHAIT